jgi:hypothetical protein
METPTKRWRRGYERFDRKLGFVIGPIVGFTILFFTVAADSPSSHDAVIAGVCGGAAFGLVCALFGDKALWALAKWLS